MTDADPPESEEHRIMVREIGRAMHIIVERELACPCEMVLIVRPMGTKRAYFVTNTPHAGSMMTELMEHLPTGAAEAMMKALREKERMN